MMKIYPQDLVKSIQKVIDSGKVEITTFKNYDENFIKEINSCDIHIKFTIDNNRRDAIIVINNSDITSQFINTWRTSAPGKFMARDFKRNNKDFIGNTLYHIVKFELNGEKMMMLVRLLNEITEDCSTETMKELIEEYGDLTISGKIFSLIKIVRDNNRDGWNSWDRYKSRDNNYHMNLYESSSYIDEADDDNNDNNEIEDDSNESEPLF